MNITGLYTQNLTLSFNSSSFSSPVLTPASGNQRTGTEGRPLAAPAAVPGTDTLSISAEAIRRQTVVVTLTLPPAPSQAPSPAETAQAETREPTRGEALFDALDADGDGTITKKEFVDGARALLQHSRQHGRSQEHPRGDRIDDSERHERSSERLTQRLERLFDRIDKNEDGGVEKAELVSALHRSRSGRPVAEPPAASEQLAPVAPAIVEVSLRATPPASSATPSQAIVPEADPAPVAAVPRATNGESQAPVSQTPPAGSFLTITQITITIAIQQYTSVSTGGTTEPSSTLRTAA